MDPLSMVHRKAPSADPALPSMEVILASEAVVAVAAVVEVTRRRKRRRRKRF